MLGIININKPSGITSNYVVTKVKKTFNTKKVGHFGTLDPLAKGVLPIAIGKATKLFDYFLNKDKTYVATFKFGIETDTLDIEGTVNKISENIPTKEQILEVLPSFFGNQPQIPPMYSAKSINGERAYNLARKGIFVELKPKNITIFDIKLLEQIDKETFKFEIHCSSGTYIRSIARDLGYKLNSFAIMTELLRTTSGPFILSQSINLDDLTKESNILTIEDVLGDLKRVYLDHKYLKYLVNGVIFDYFDYFDKAIIFCDDKIFGIGECKDNKLKILINLYEI